MRNYEKLEYLGNGSNGNQVFKVRNINTNEIYAMKIISMIGNCSDFLNEINILKSLDHPNIVKYQDSFKQEDTIIVIMEFVDFGDLNKVIKSRKESNDYLDEDQIWKWFFELSSALEYIHSKKILHRDIKVHNAFINSLGHVKLGDFGISKLLECSIDYTNSTLGTPYYLSPEICSLDKYNLKTDIWMLGCLFYELSTFNRPFVGDSIPAIVNSIKNKNPEEIEKTRYSQDLITIIGKMLIKDQKMRPSIKELIDDDIVKKKYSEILVEGKKRIDKMKSSLVRNNHIYFNVSSVNCNRKKINKSSSMNADYNKNKNISNNSISNNINGVRCNSSVKKENNCKSISNSNGINNDNGNRNDGLINNNNILIKDSSVITNNKLNINKSSSNIDVMSKENSNLNVEYNNNRKRNNSDYILSIINKNTNSNTNNTNSITNNTHNNNDEDYNNNYPNCNNLLLETNKNQGSYINNNIIPHNSIKTKISKTDKKAKGINSSMPQISSSTKMYSERKSLKIMVEDNGETEEENEKFINYKQNSINIYKKKFTKYNNNNNNTNITNVSMNNNYNNILLLSYYYKIYHIYYYHYSVI